MQTRYTAPYTPSISSNLLAGRCPLPSGECCISEPAGNVIYLVADDWLERETLTDVLSAGGMNVVSFASTAEYLAFDRTDTSACLVLDIHGPDMSSVELQGRFANCMNPPIVFLSGVCDIPTVVRAMKTGAIDVLSKPIDFSALVTAIRAGFAQDLKRRQRKAERARLRERLSLLTPREHEVFPLIVAGLLNKQSAAILGVSEITFRIHRGRVMRKMEATSFAELIRMAVKLRVPHWRGHVSADRVAAPTAQQVHLAA